MVDRRVLRLFVGLNLLFAACGSRSSAPDGAGGDGADLADVVQDPSGDLGDAPDGGGGSCSTDRDCAFGAEWCIGGSCVACDNSGVACDILCRAGWSTYSRHGCWPCDCAPVNACGEDGDCGPGQRCYAGAFCWDWCPPGDPSCCHGNLCSAAGCTPPPPAGCMTRGCPQGQTCEPTGCSSSACSCSAGAGGAGWICTRDCGGGTCVSPCSDGRPSCNGTCCGAAEDCCTGATPPFCYASGCLACCMPAP